MDIQPHIPPLLIGEELTKAMTVLPKYETDIRKAPAAARLIELNKLYDIYIPSAMTAEIYSKLYLAFIRSVEKKKTISATKQAYENRKAVRGQPYRGIMGGSDSFTIIGVSGIGKSSAIHRSVELISQNPFWAEKCHKIAPFLTVQTPGDASLKGLLMEIIRTIDTLFDTRYYTDAIRSRATVDMLIGMVSQACLNYVCVLIIDEAQNLVSSKNGQTLVNALVQLINNSGISLCFVGTPSCASFFESAFQLARRSVGLNYQALPYDSYFCRLCETLFRYQYTETADPLTDKLVEWLYLHSGGITAVLVGLIQSAQEIAIIDGSECLCMESLYKAYRQRMGVLHRFIAPKTTPHTSTVRITEDVVTISVMAEDNNAPPTVTEMISKAKTLGIDCIDYLRRYVSVTEVAI